MTIDAQVLILGTSIIGFIILLFYLQNRRIERTLENITTDDSRELLLQWLAEMRSGIDRNADMMSRQLSHANETLNQRLDSTAQLLRLLNKDLGQVHQVGEQMRDFQHFFRSPKMRGKIGEQIMAEILQQVLPRATFKLQHRFGTGAIVDALVQLEAGAVAIDAKFPLENFQKAVHALSPEQAQSFKNQFWRDVRKHIDAIHNKYILPQEGTLDFAVMYIPSETLYYEILTNDELVKKAEKQNILFVSPNTFYYFLKLILVGLFSRRIEKTAARVLQQLKALQKNSKSMSDEMRTLLTHLGNSRHSSERLDQKIQELQRRLEEISDIEGTAGDGLEG